MKSGAPTWTESGQDLSRRLLSTDPKIGSKAAASLGRSPVRSSPSFRRNHTNWQIFAACVAGSAIESAMVRLVGRTARVSLPWCRSCGDQRCRPVHSSRTQSSCPARLRRRPRSLGHRQCRIGSVVRPGSSRSRDGISGCVLPGPDLGIPRRHGDGGLQAGGHRRSLSGLARMARRRDGGTSPVPGRSDVRGR
jgi:hypothetical protein